MARVARGVHPPLLPAVPRVRRATDPVGAGEAAGPEDAEMMMPPLVSTHAGRLSLGPQPACAGRLLVRLLAVRPICIVARVELRQD